MADADGFKPLSAYIVAAKRTAGGRQNGRISGWHPVDLGAEIVDAVLDSAGVSGDDIDDVIFGCVGQVGAGSNNIARNIILSTKKLPETVPGYTLDRQCGSSQQAIHAASQAVMSGTQDVVIAGGVEIMSLVGIGAAAMAGHKAGHGGPNGKAIKERWSEKIKEAMGPMGLPTNTFSQFGGGELLAKKWSVTREECDSFGVRSHQLAAAATKSGAFKNEIHPVEIRKSKGEDKGVHDADEGVRPDTNMGALGKLKTLNKGGVITAGSSSQICDGAAAIIICNERGLKKLGVKPRAKIVSLGLAGTDPLIMLEGPIPASKQALTKAKMTMSDIDKVEINEAFAPIPLAWCKAMTDGDVSKVNTNGGAIGLGHPLGATGCKLMTTLLHDLERNNLKRGLLAICEGGGTANATIIERMDGGSKL